MGDARTPTPPLAWRSSAAVLAGAVLFNLGQGVLRPSTPGVPLMGVTNAVLIAIQTGVLVFLFPLYLFQRASAGPETVGFVVSLSVFGRLVALWLGGSLSDRWGRMRVLTPGLLIYAALLASMSRLTDPTLLGVWSFAIGAASGLVAPIPTALSSAIRCHARSKAWQSGGFEQ